MSSTTRILARSPTACMLVDLGGDPIHVCWSMRRPHKGIHPFCRIHSKEVRPVQSSPSAPTSSTFVPRPPDALLTHAI
eukprot:1161360-Pelagomonas_calceolata.AAC.13